MTTAAPEAPAAPATPAPAAAAPAAAPATPAPAAAAPAAKPEDKGTILGGKPEGAKPKEEAKPQGAPDKYEGFKLPEGIEIKADVLEKFSATAKELNLSQENAQKLIDMQAQNVKAEVDARLAAFNAEVQTWETKSREVFGAEWQKEFGIASKAVERFGTPELRKLLNDTGLGNHPEWIRFANKAGKMIAEDNPPEGRTAGNEQVDTAKLMFPTMNKK